MRVVLSTEIIPLLILIFFSVLMHELGHMIAYRAFTKNDDWKIKIGSGKPIFTIGKFTINSIFMWSGVFIPSKRVEGKAHLILYHLGGVLMNLVAVALRYILMFILDFTYTPFFEMILRLSVSANMWCIILALIPCKYPSWMGIVRGYESDGIKVYRLLKMPKKRVLR